MAVKIIASPDVSGAAPEWAAWHAVTEDYDGAPDSHCPIGFGATEQEAIADLLQQIEDAMPDLTPEALQNSDWLGQGMG